MKRHSNPRSDRGSVLPIVLVIVVVLGTVVVGVARYAATSLRYGTIVESRTDRVAAARAGVRDVIDRIGNSQFPLCSTAAGTVGVDVTLPDIGGARVTVNCLQSTGELPDIAGWALIVTGAGDVPDGAGLITDSGSEKVIAGPTFVARTGLLGLHRDLLIDDGDLWYTDAVCSDGGQLTGGASGHLRFDSPIRGTWCTNRPWHGLFRAPTVPTLPSTLAPDPQEIAGCRVFSPGRYTAPPEWGATGNYLRSGDYVFEGSYEISVDQTVTAGREGVDNDEQQISNPLCDPIRNADTPDGASLYLDGSTHLTVSGAGSLEIMRRRQGDDAVSIQTLPTHTLVYPSPVLSTQAGDTAQMTIHGMVWAPDASLELGPVANTVMAQIVGGAVVAAVDIDSSGSADQLAVGLQGAPRSDTWVLTATATKDGASTVVRVVADVRHSSTDAGQTVWEIGQRSWRVCDPAGC